MFHTTFDPTSGRLVPVQGHLVLLFSTVRFQPLNEPFAGPKH
jgi:hypothetical protein